MILSLQNTPFALLMQGLRLRPATARSGDAALRAKAPKSAVVPHWIDFLNDDDSQAPH